jgi:Holliday junction resolvase RusA-like endonuclease
MTTTSNLMLEECYDPICFTVPGIPIAQPRQRHRVVNGHAQNYTPAKSPVNVYKAAIQLAAKEAFTNPWPHSVSIRLKVLAVFPRPKSRTTKRGPNRRYPHTSRPDWDNIGKAISDCLNGVIWHDDAQICEVEVKKVVAAADESPRTEIEIWPEPE